MGKREVTSLQLLIEQSDGLALCFIMFCLVSILRLNTFEAGFRLLRTDLFPVDPHIQGVAL